jgi:nitroreductase
VAGVVGPLTPSGVTSMDFDRVVRRRRMVRNYDESRPVPAEVVDRLLEYAVHAPSAGFSQGWGFLVLTDAADRELFWCSGPRARPR